MAYLFDDANTEYLSRADTLGLSGYPFTFACWYNCNDQNINGALVSFGDTDANNYQELRLRDPADSDIIMFSVGTGGSFFAGTSAQWTANTWQHACGVATAGSPDRWVFLNAANKGTHDTAVAWTGLDNFIIGATKSNSAVANYMSGYIAEAAVWNIELTDAEVAVLAAGFSPLFVRPQNLVAYWPLIRDLNDKVGGYNLTAVSGDSGPIVSPHPPIIYPSAPYIIHAVAEVGEAITMAGVSASASALTGNIYRLRVMEGISAGAGAITGNIYRNRVLAGVSTATSTVSGILSKIGTLTIAGVVVATSSITGNIVRLRTLIGTSAATSSITGNIVRMRILAAISAGVSGLTGALTVVTEAMIALAGTVTAVSAVAGTLSVAIWRKVIIRGIDLVSGQLVNIVGKIKF